MDMDGGSFGRGGCSVRLEGEKGEGMGWDGFRPPFSFT